MKKILFLENIWSLSLSGLATSAVHLVFGSIPITIGILVIFLTILLTFTIWSYWEPKRDDLLFRALFWHKKEDESVLVNTCEVPKGIAISFFLKPLEVLLNRLPEWAGLPIFAAGLSITVLQLLRFPTPAVSAKDALFIGLMLLSALILSGVLTKILILVLENIEKRKETLPCKINGHPVYQQGPYVGAGISMDIKSMSKKICQTRFIQA